MIKTKIVKFGKKKYKYYKYPTSKYWERMVGPENKRRKVRLHQDIISNGNGEKLFGSGYDVDHKNGNKNHNTKENLKKMKHSNHSRKTRFTENVNYYLKRLNEEVIEKDASITSHIIERVKFDIIKIRTIEKQYKRAVKVKGKGTFTLTTNDVIHEDIVDALAKYNIISHKHKRDWWVNPESLEEFICLENVNNKWAISESYDSQNKKIIKKVKKYYPNVVLEI